MIECIMYAHVPYLSISGYIVYRYDLGGTKKLGDSKKNLMIDYLAFFFFFSYAPPFFSTLFHFLSFAYLFFSFLNLFDCNASSIFYIIY